MTGESGLKVGGLLLAAGGSSRLGRPKQLIQYKGQSLIRQAAETLTLSACDLVIVVLGAEVNASREQLAGLPVNTCVNKDWRTGISSSIKAGLNELMRLEPGLDAVLITLCDQPHISFGTLGRFVAMYRVSQPPVIAARYAGTGGVPALFSRDLFENLLSLVGDKGARDLIHGHPHAAFISVEQGSRDIDTIADMDRLGGT